MRIDITGIRMNKKKCGMPYAIIASYKNTFIFIFAIVMIYWLHAIITSSQRQSAQVRQYVNMKDLVAAAVYAAEKGGQKVYEIRVQDSLSEKSKGKTEEGANDPLTEGDLQSHFQMYYSLKKAFPFLTIISEEKPKSEVGGKDVSPAPTENSALGYLPEEFVGVEDIKVWIDPLDATQEYTENLRQFVTTMVCVAIRGVPVIGVVYKPFERTTTWAWVDQKSSPDLVVGSKGSSSSIRNPLNVIISRSHPGEVVSAVKKAYGDNTHIVKAGGAGYKTLEVVSGKEDLYFHNTYIKKWDLCAGNAILKHLGGRMTTLKGEDLDYGSEDSYLNKDGVLAAVHNHDVYLKKYLKS